MLYDEMCCERSEGIDGLGNMEIELDVMIPRII
jgi:hypothetical protein